MSDAISSLSKNEKLFEVFLYDSQNLMMQLFFTSMNGMQPFPHLESKTPESNGKFWLNLFSPFLSVLELSICSKIAEKMAIKSNHILEN